MNKIFNIVLAIGTLAVLSSCEDFFTREPINKFSAETYFSSESELQMYVNGMLNSYLPNPTETQSGDSYNDLIATKTSSDFFRADVPWDNNKQGGWSWGWLRRCNYMLTYMSNAKDKVSEELYNHYEGVVRFWRAYHYADKIKTFSDVPWTDEYLQPDSPILFEGRHDREYVVSKIVEDLEFAREHVLGTSQFHNDTRSNIDKFVVNALAARIYLYEGTFKKNVKNNPSTGKAWTNEYQSANDLIQLAADAAKVVMDQGGFKLSPDYKGLFINNDLNVDETIWGYRFQMELNGRHSYTRYFNSSTLGQQYSGTKDLVRMFLKKDGKPVATGEQPVYEEFTDRDTRLDATVLGPGRKVTGLDSKEKDADPNFTFCKTGYMLVKWCIPNELHYQNSIDENDIPLVRYAEVLLIYAEAMNELGKMSKDIWNATVGALRERAGVKNIYPGDAGYVADTWLRDYYTKDVQYVPTLNDIALEIRRERVTELTTEGGLRQDDVYRYGQADLIERRYNHQGWAGIWIPEADLTKGFKYNPDGATYMVNSSVDKNSETGYPISDTNNLNWSLEKAGNGYYLVYNYKLRWEERMYCRPIPLTAVTINPQLGENYGW